MATAKQLEKRYEQFLKECLEHGIANFRPQEVPKLKNYFTNMLPDLYGDGLDKASFEEIIDNMDGCGITKIQTYIDENNSGTREIPKLPANKEEESKPAVRESAGEEEETKKAGAKESPKAEAVKQDRAVAETKTDKKQKKQIKTAADYLSISEKVPFHKGSVLTKEEKERVAWLKRNLLILKRERSITTERVSIQRTDLLLFRAIIDYAKQSGQPVNVAGIEVTDTSSLMNAAMALVAADLAESGQTHIFEHTKQSAGNMELRIKEIDEKIENLTRELESLQ